MKQSKKLQQGLEILAVAVLLLYPLRHIFQGVDLQDTGYNYANFVYMGMEHMDPMWLFSTYLANVVGHFLTFLPFAGNLAGMNFYTGLFVSLLAILGYFFCTRELHFHRIPTFLGEMAAISLCWCPTAKLYDYLGFVLMLVCCMLLYKGLVYGRNWMLFAAGVCLGTNILVRFSNIPQAGLILAVWCYAVLEGLEEKGNGIWRKIWRYTLWCLAGYVASLILWFGWIHFRYGLGTYVESVSRLFAMTDTATDYKATAMLYSLVHTYVQNSYWMIRLGLIGAAGLVGFAFFYLIAEKTAFFGKRPGLVAVMKKIMCGAWIAVSAGSIYWLYSRRFFSFLYYSYDSMLLPGVLFLLLTMIIAVIRIFTPSCPKEEKLVGGILILVLILISIGSNNGVFPSLNHLFVAAPYTFWQCQRFLFGTKRVEIWKGRLSCDPFPLKGILVAFLGLFLVQSLGFGAVFVFTESTGARNMTAKVSNNKILAGVWMNPDKARWLQEATDCIEENGLKGREVILYGNVASLSYYLEMPSVFNPWSDLASYQLATMEAEMEKLRASMDTGERPVIIANNIYVQREEGGVDALRRIETDENYISEIMKDPKWTLISEFMADYGYELIYGNEKFGIWK